MLIARPTGCADTRGARARRRRRRRNTMTAAAAAAVRPPERERETETLRHAAKVFKFTEWRAKKRGRDREAAIHDVH